MAWHGPTRCSMRHAGSSARHREAAWSRGAIGAQAHARRRRGVMVVGVGKWCWPSLLAFKEDK
jgi:hypothetical protein